MGENENPAVASISAMRRDALAQAGIGHMGLAAQAQISTIGTRRCPSLGLASTGLDGSCSHEEARQPTGGLRCFITQVCHELSGL